MKYLPAYIIAIVAVLDQATKALARQSLSAGVPVEVTPFFNLSLGYNRGVVFGLGANATWGPWPLIALTGAVAVALTIWLLREPDRPFRAALALVIGGAIGNLCDRILRGAVTDFLDFHIGDAHWPSFNVADAAIVAGVASILWLAFKGRV